MVIEARRANLVIRDELQKILRMISPQQVMQKGCDTMLDRVHVVAEMEKA